MSNEKLILRLKELMPAHINPYNLGDQGEISKIISQLSPESNPMVGGEQINKLLKSQTITP